MHKINPSPEKVPYIPREAHAPVGKEKGIVLPMLLAHPLLVKAEPKAKKSLCQQKIKEIGQFITDLIKKIKACFLKAIGKGKKKQLPKPIIPEATVEKMTKKAQEIHKDNLPPQKPEEGQKKVEKDIPRVITIESPLFSDDLYKEIFKKLDSQSLAAISCVNKKFNTMATTNMQGSLEKIRLEKKAFEFWERALNNSLVNRDFEKLFNRFKLSFPKKAISFKNIKSIINGGDLTWTSVVPAITYAKESCSSDDLKILVELLIAAFDKASAEIVKGEYLTAIGILDPDRFFTYQDQFKTYDTSTVVVMLATVVISGNERHLDKFINFINSRIDRVILEAAFFDEIIKNYNRFGRSFELWEKSFLDKMAYYSPRMHLAWAEVGRWEECLKSMMIMTSLYCEEVIDLVNQCMNLSSESVKSFLQKIQEFKIEEFPDFGTDKNKKKEDVLITLAKAYLTADRTKAQEIVEGINLSTLTPKRLAAIAEIFYALGQHDKIKTIVGHVQQSSDLNDKIDALFCIADLIKDQNISEAQKLFENSIELSKFLHNSEEILFNVIRQMANVSPLIAKQFLDSRRGEKSINEFLEDIISAIKVKSLQKYLRPDYQNFTYTYALIDPQAAEDWVEKQLGNQGRGIRDAQDVASAYLGLADAVKV